MRIARYFVMRIAISHWNNVIIASYAPKREIKTIHFIFNVTDFVAQLLLAELFLISHG
jgi:hypothetical protein